MKENSLHVLLVEDNAGDARLLREMFSKEKRGNFHLTHLLRMRDAEILLAEGGVDILLLDMGLPDGHGLDTVRRAHAAAPDVPMIVLTGLDDEKLAAEAITEGAQDYLIKGQIENRALPRALRYAIERHRMQGETDFIRAEQLQLKDEFLSHVSHELRSPLTSIYSFSTIIADGLAGPTNPQQDEYLEIILRNVRQLRAMIEDLLEVTRAQTGKLSIDLQCVSVPDSITYAANTFKGAAVANGITLTCHSGGQMPFVIADPIRLRQVLSILLDNAIKFTPIGGEVHVETTVPDDDLAFLIVCVSDSGCGVAPEMAEHIFEHLYQVAGSSRAGREGLGLGLHIAKELITSMRGKIWVESHLGRGSRFYFTVPVFSLSGLIASILLPDDTSNEAIAVLVVEIRAKNDMQNVTGEVMKLARILLKECLRPETDLLLPIQSQPGKHNIFLVVACTHEQGAQIIGKRILRHFHRHELLQPADFTLSISHSFLQPLFRGANESMDSFVNQVTAGLQRHIDTITS